jgi:tetratricopeptide (TPR) repeat protein
VLVLEDLQWGDLPTVRFIDAALRELRELPWMVLALGRPEVTERFPDLWKGRAVQVLQLPPLARKAGERLVRQALGSTVDSNTMERLVAQADGNPFYLEELIRAAAGGRGEALPETVIAMVQSRLAGLDEEARRALRAASIFGEVFRADAVALLLGSEALPEPVYELLEKLVEQEVLVQRTEGRLPGEREYAFRHALLREGAYAMLVEEDRALGHRLAAEWLEAQGGRDPIMLAEHLVRGRMPGHAARFYQKAAEQALIAGDVAAAAAHAQRGIDCGAPEAMRIELLGLLCETYLWNLHWDAAVPRLEEVLRLAAPGSAPWGRAMTIRLSVAMGQSRIDELKVISETLRNVTPSPAALQPVALALSAAAHYLDQVGYIETADSLMERLHTLIAPVAQEEPVAAGWVDSLWSRRIGFLKEDPWRGMLEGQVGLSRFGKVHHPQGIAGCSLFIAINLWLLGALPEAEAELRRLEDLDEMLSDAVAFRRFALAGVLTDRGALTEARHEAERMVEIGRARQLFPVEGRGLWALAEVLRREEDLAAAETAARAACERLSSLLPDQVPAVATLAAILLAEGRTEEACATAQEAMSRYHEVGVCNFARSSFLYTVHAECLHARGDEAGARRGIAKACERLEATAERIGDPRYRQSFYALPERVRLLALARDWLGGDNLGGIRNEARKPD